MNNRTRQVLVIGYGEMGHAMEYLLSRQHRLQFWDLHPPDPHEPVVLEQATPDAEFVLFCVPVTPLGELVDRVRPHLSPDGICLSVAKGLDAAGRPAPAIFRDVLGNAHQYGVLYGPMIAEEILAGRPAYAQVGCSPVTDFRQIDALFRGTGLQLEYSSDITGIAWSSVLKNVYAILFGAADELRLGDNVRGFLTVASVTEMAGIVRDQGGLETSVHQLAGLGDLVTTATSRSSNHRNIGRQLARGNSSGIQGEGIHTLAMVRQFALIDEKRYPLFGLVRDIVDDPVDAGQRILACLQAM